MGPQTREMRQALFNMHCLYMDSRLGRSLEAVFTTLFNLSIFLTVVEPNHTDREDLPRGWEKTLTQDGILYYVDHVNLRTSFQHPITGETSAIAMATESPTSSPNESSVLSPPEPVAKQRKPHSDMLTRRRSGSGRSSGRRKVVNKPPEAKRSTESPVSMKGWLYKQESGGLKSWKRRWFVLSDFCIFYYRGPDEGQSLGSILLPSYKVNPCISKDSISKKFAFKAEHTNMRTYIFAAESKEEMSKWMNAMSLATILQKDPSMEQQYSDRPRHQRPDERPDDDGGFRSVPRPVSLTLHGRAPYADDWGSAPSSDNSEHIQTSPRVQAGQGSYPRQWQQPQQQWQQPQLQRQQQHRQQSQQQPQQQWQQSEPMNNCHVLDPAFSHNGDVKHRSMRNPAMADPRYGHGPSSPDESKLDPRYPDQGSKHHPGYPGRQPQQHQPHPDKKYFPDPHCEQQNAQTRMDETSPRSTQQIMPGARYPTRNSGFTGTSPPRAPMGHLDRFGPHTAAGASKGGHGSPRMQQDNLTPLRDMSDNRPGSDTDRGYLGQVKKSRQDSGKHCASLPTQSDWMAQTMDPAGKRQNRNLAQPAGQHPGRPSASLPNHYSRETIPTRVRQNTFDNRDRRDDLRPPGGITRSPDAQTNRLRTNRSPTSDGSSSHSSRSNQCRGKRPVKKSLFGDQPPGGSTHQSPRSQQQLASCDNPRRYFEPLTIQTGPIYENLNQMPPQITVSNITPADTPTSPSREGPTRPPLPASLRDNYVRELAKSRSPHTREDMLNATTLAARRQHEPLIFRYPTTAQAAKYPSSSPPAKLAKPQPQQQRSPPVVPPHGKTQQYGADNDNYPESYWTAKRNLERKSEGVISTDVMTSHSEALTTEPDEIEQKERNRLQKYIDRSFKRLSIGDSLPGLFNDTSKDRAMSSDDIFGEPVHSRSASLGGTLWQSDRSRAKSTTLSHNPERYLFDDGSKQLSRSWKDLSSLSHDHDFSPHTGAMSQSLSKSQSELSPSGLEKLGKMQWETRISKSMDAMDTDDDDVDSRAAVVQGHGQGQQFTYWTTDGSRAADGSAYHSPGAQPMTGGSASPQVGPGRQLPPNTGHNISTIPEDPDMITSDLLTTKNLMSLQQKLANQGLRLSICASDLIGKSHEELVLLLIQLRRSQARLRDAKSYCRSRLDDSRDNEKGYKFRQSNSFGGLEDGEEEEHDKFLQLRKQKEQLQKQMEVHKPLVNLVDNMVTMGSLYGGDNLMMASQYKKHRLRPDQVMPVKPMIEFSRKHQEDKLAHEQQEELRELTEDEVDLEEKLQQLYESDRELQEKSFLVQSLQEDKELLEKALEGIVVQERDQRDPRELQNLLLQRRNIDSELLRVRQQLADSSKRLEEVAADNARVEHEVVLLRSRIHGLDKSCSSPSLSQETVKTRQKLERELSSIQTVISGLSHQRRQLSETMQSLRHSTPDLSTAADKAPEAAKSGNKPYMETDVDTMQSRDISLRDDAHQGEGDWQSTSLAGGAGLRRATAIDNISSATIRSPSTIPHVDHNEHLRQVPPQVARQNVPRTFRESDGTSEIEHHHVPRTYTDDNGTPEIERHHIPRTYTDDHGTPEIERHHVPQTYRDDNGTPEIERHHVSRTYTDDNGTPEIERHHVPRTYRDDNGTPEIEHHLVPRTYRDDNGTPEIERHHVPRTYTDDNGTPEIEHHHVPRTYRDDNGTPEIERHHIPRTYNRTAPPFGSNPHTVQLGPTSDQPYQSVYEDRSESSRRQPSQTSEWHDAPYEAVRQGEDLSPDTPTEYTDSYSPRDSSDFDENTKRFYGLLPREKARGQTVRKVKKNESERRGRDRWRSPIGGADAGLAPASQRSKSVPRQTPSQTTRGPQVKQKSYDDSMTRLSSNADKSGPKQSAAARLFPSGIPASYASSGQTVNSKERVRRISDLFTPRPFGVRLTSGVRSVSASRLESDNEAAPTDETNSQNPSVTTMYINPATWKPSQPVSRTITTATVKPMTASSVPSENQPNVKRGSASGLTPREKLRMRRMPGNRFQTISSSEPVKLERTPTKPVNIHTTAGDLISSRHDSNLPELVRADIINPEEFDVETINRLVLGVPEKVDIPDRYVPESDEELTQEEKQFHEEKAQKLKKLLAAQSLQDWSKAELDVRWSRDELGSESQMLHHKVEAEKVRREHMLDIRQVLAREVMQKSREVAATRLRQLSTAGEGDDVESDPEVNSPTNNLYREMTSHKMAAIPLDQRQSFYT